MLRVTPPHSTDCVRVRRRIYLHMSVYYVCSSPTHTALPHTQLTTDTANMHTYLQYIYRLVYACVRASVCVSYIISIYYKCLLVCVCVCVRACVCVCVCVCVMVDVMVPKENTGDTSRPLIQFVCISHPSPLSAPKRQSHTPPSSKTPKAP